MLVSRKLVNHGSHLIREIEMDPHIFVGVHFSLPSADRGGRHIAPSELRMLNRADLGISSM